MTMTLTTRQRSQASKRRTMTSGALKSVLAAGAAMTFLAPTAGSAEETPADLNSTLDKAASGGKIIFDARLRYSFAEFDNIANEANGVTYRVRAGFETGAVFNTKLLVDFEHGRSIVDDFNSTLNGNTQFPVVADPDSTELNRLQLTNTSIDDTKITLGRQRIILDDSRFVGNVGWRNNEQTYDALRVENTSIKGLKIDVSYIDQVNRIFSEDSPQGRFESDSYLANVAYQSKTDIATVTLTGFAYLLDFENDNIPGPAARLSTQTYGGTLKAASGPVWFKGSFANQTPYGENANSFDVNYYNVAGGFKYEGFSVGGGIEVLGGDGSFGFVTPLATLHKFNGFADVFLGTPGGGLQDLYASVDYTKKGIGPFALLKAAVFYHDFSAEEGGAAYGEEIDVLAVAKFKAAKRIKYLVKYASYDAEGFATDRERLTVQAELAF